MADSGTEVRRAKFTYFRGRGLGEMVRFLLAACGYEIEPSYLDTPEDLARLRAAGLLFANQVPLLEVEGSGPVVQSMACLRFLARKHGFYGNPGEEVLVDMVGDTVRDFLSKFTGLPFMFDKEGPGGEDLRAVVIDEIATRWAPKYLAVLERALRENPYNKDISESLPVPPTSLDAVATADGLVAVKSFTTTTSEDEKGGEGGEGDEGDASSTSTPLLPSSPSRHGLAREVPLLVGNSITWPDVTLTEVTLYCEEIIPDVLDAYPLLSRHLAGMRNWGGLKKYLESPLRHPVGDRAYKAAVNAVLS